MKIIVPQSSGGPSLPASLRAGGSGGSGGRGGAGRVGGSILCVSLAESVPKQWTVGGGGGGGGGFLWVGDGVMEMILTDSVCC